MFGCIKDEIALSAFQFKWGLSKFPFIKYVTLVFKGTYQYSKDSNNKCTSFKSYISD